MPVRPVSALRMIKTDLTPQQVKTRLRKYLSADDELLVVEAEAATRTLN